MSEQDVERRTDEERLRHLPDAPDPTSGIRFCLICDLEWPCPVRKGQKA